jgi:hypothetical protein
VRERKRGTLEQLQVTPPRSRSSGRSPFAIGSCSSR